MEWRHVRYCCTAFPLATAAATRWEHPLSISVLTISIRSCAMLLLASESRVLINTRWLATLPVKLSRLIHIQAGALSLSLTVATTGDSPSLSLSSSLSSSIAHQSIVFSPRLYKKKKKKMRKGIFDLWIVIKQKKNQKKGPSSYCPPMKQLEVLVYAERVKKRNGQYLIVLWWMWASSIRARFFLCKSWPDISQCRRWRSGGKKK